MNTFLPYPNFEQSAKVLDRQRLGKQRVECLQILNVLLLNKVGWRNHPAVLMWKGYEIALAKYAIVICDEWTGRGYKDSIKNKIIDLIKNSLKIDLSKEVEISLPEWFGRNDFHLAHQSNLLRKDYNYYSKYFTDVPDNLEYLWR